MKRIYHLSTCDTCRKILAGLNTSGVELINLREQSITASDLDFMYEKTGSYEALFNKRAQKWKLIPETERPKNDTEFKGLILGEYTFLKRPAAIIGDKVFAGNDVATVNALTSALKNQ